MDRIIRAQMCRHKFTTGRFLALALLVCLALPGMAATPCATVTSTDDSATALTTPGTLRYATAQANAGTCDTITFSLTYPATITLAQGLLKISNASTPIVISGPGATSLFISGNNASQVFLIDVGTTVTISGVTVENGSDLPGNGGGGIVNDGTLTVSNSTLSGNSSTKNGGAIFDNGTLTVTNSTFSNNTAGDHGGGVINDGGMLTVTGSTFSVNMGSTGGAIFNGGTANVTNSTFSGNPASINGGGIDNSGTLNVSFSTFSGNSATANGGGINNIGTVTVKNTLLASSPSGGNCSNAVGTFTSDGYNLSDDNSCTSFIQPSDINGTSAGLAGGLASNGGPTQTIALGAGSPAIDAIPVTPTNYCTDVAGNPVTTDQRGITRPQGSACDIGAFELVQSVAFASLSARLTAVIGGPLPGFNLDADFKLGATSNGILPLTEPVTLSVGTYNVTIPAGSFKQLGNIYNYLGEINGVGLLVTIVPQSANRYQFIADAIPVTLAHANPVTVTITIGDDTGTKAVTANFITLGRP